MDHLDDFEFISELALSGDMRSIEALLPSAQGCSANGKQLIVALGNADEAALVESLTVLPAKHLLEVSAHLHQRAFIQPWVKSASDSYQEHAQLRDVIEQLHAKRAMEVAAAGGHHLLFCGPPGTGKTMLASRLGGILPPLSNSEAM